MKPRYFWTMRNPSVKSPRLVLSVAICVAVATVWTSGVMAAALVAPTINIFPIPTSSSAPAGITNGPNGNLWFTEPSADRIATSTTAGQITVFQLGAPGQPGPRPVGITAGSDGNLWFTAAAIGSIGRITTAGIVTEFPLTGALPASIPSITAGPDGSVWFVEDSPDAIASISPFGLMKQFALPTQGGLPSAVTNGPDGALWFTEPGANKIGRFSPATQQFEEFPIPASGSDPRNITAGPDGNLWFTETAANQIGIITPAGVITEVPIPTSQSAPVGITSGPDGAVWFTESAANQVGRAAIADSVTISEFPIGQGASTPGPMTIGADTNLWALSASGIVQFIPGNKVDKANVKIMVAASAPSVAAGSTLTYTATVKNLHQRGVATDVMVTAAVPPGASFVSASATSAVIVPPPVGGTGKITANLGSIPIHGSASFQITVNVLGPPNSLLTFSAVVSAASAEVVPGNNSQMVQTRIKDGGGVVQLAWTPGASAGSAPTGLTIGLASGQPDTDVKAPKEAVRPAADTCAPVAYNVYVANLPSGSQAPTVQPPMAPWVLVATVLPAASTVTTTAPIAPAGSFYIVTALWSCNSVTTESGGSNIVSACSGPVITDVRINGKVKENGRMKVFGSGFTSSVVVTIGDIGFEKSPTIFSGNSGPALIQDGLLTNGQTIREATTSGTLVIINFSQNGCISSAGFTRH
jgi:virginiamycin B lyase